MCNCRKNKNGPLSAVKNLASAAATQANPIQWFKDGVTGLVKCIGHIDAYSKEDIEKNRDVCRSCEYNSTHKDNDLTTTSQCMAPDPSKNGEICGCFIVCRTAAGPGCVLNKWTHLTVGGS